MKLAIFDIDGTLTATNEVDSESYLEAVVELLGNSAVSSEWTQYPEVTDRSLLEHLCLERLGRHPTSYEVRRVQEALLAHFEKTYSVRPAAFAAVRGACDFIRALQSSPDWAVFLATGAWACSARFKLRAVGLSDLPMVACDSFDGRAEIVRRAIGLAPSGSWESLQRVVLVGDAAWDLATARELNLPFVAIASGEEAKALIDQGASHVLADFTNFESAIEALTNACVPSVGRCLTSAE